MQLMIDIDPRDAAYLAEIAIHRGWNVAAQKAMAQLAATGGTIHRARLSGIAGGCEASPPEHDWQLLPPRTRRWANQTHRTIR